ncbi:MAG: hypothetical protein OEV49_02265 [candidate division Zixibacteria bacterium]|nr:hypothetical protein [candidate division Zixibacteria bacterium]MDH3938170.1 hypothetical protein [candidate division Zixibacteria bacterium]MDH4033410.1 hypothetical protein [candidate division Zixibacteria bacterium]
MSGNRIVYQNWIVDLGRDPETQCQASDSIDADQSDRRAEQICQTVDVALYRLDDEEREFIIRFHYMGESYRQISDKSGRPVHKLEALHKRSLKKLRRLLAPLADEVFGLRAGQEQACPVCNSKYLVQLNEIIRNRDRRQTWKPVLNLFRTKYNLTISSPQLLVGHEKYH